MAIKHTKHFLDKLENLFNETEFILRYEKGNFKSGYCVLNESKIVIVNKYFPLAGKINALVDILIALNFDQQDFIGKSNQDFLTEIRQNNFKF
jgi:hypothetical protein